MKCFAKENCIMPEKEILNEDDVVVVVKLRGQYPILFAELVGAAIKGYEIYHTDCATKIGVIE